MNDHFPPEQLCSLARITAATGLRDEELLAAELQNAFTLKIPNTVIREVILQSYLFAGYAAAINAFIVFNRLSDSAESFLQENETGLELWKKRGTDLCMEIYGSQYHRLVDNMKQLHPDLAEWMIWEGYGKVLSRPFLSPRVRELLIVAMTAILQVERQFYSHVRGALNTGATAEEIRSVFAEVSPWMKPASIESFSSVLDNLLQSSRE